MAEIREEFINQAKHIARNAEVLPGGIEELAAKLQHAADTNTPLRVKLEWIQLDQTYTWDTQ